MDTLKLLRRVVYFMDKEGKEVTCVLKYELLLIFCYICGHMAHETKICDLFLQGVDPKDYQYVNG